MSLGKFLKNLSILSIFASILVGAGYGTFVYADKYTWRQLNNPTTEWNAVAMSNSVYGYAGRGGSLYFTDSRGADWAAINSFGAQFTIRSIATSKDGSYVLVSLYSNDGNGAIAVSSNFGTTFNYAPIYSNYFQGVAMSEGGLHMYVVDKVHGRILRSDDYGVNWSTVAITGYNPVSVTTSNTGRYVYVANTQNILRSEDYGASFSPVLVNPPPLLKMWQLLQMGDMYMQYLTMDIHNTRLIME